MVSNVGLEGVVMGLVVEDFEFECWEVGCFVG